MKIFCITIAFLMGIMVFSQVAEVPQFSPPEGQALVGDSYGAGVNAKTEKKAISPLQLEEKLAKKGTLEAVAVKGKVVEVCQKKGCWFTIQTEDNTQFFVKMKDYAFFVPTALEGKTVVLQGNAENKIVSVEELQHYAQDAQKSQEEIDAITEPETEIRFKASGIRVVED